MTRFEVNQRVFIKENTQTDKWIPTNGRKGGLWIQKNLGDSHYHVFDGQSTFIVPESDLKRGNKEFDLDGYF